MKDNFLKTLNDIKKFFEETFNPKKPNNKLIKAKEKFDKEIRKLKEM